MLAERITSVPVRELSNLVATALIVMVLLGLIGALLIALATPILVSAVFKIPTELQDESVISFYLVAAAIPSVVIGAGLRGILEAYQIFTWINVIRVGMALLTFLSPLIVLYYSGDLATVVLALVLIRWAVAILLWGASQRVLPFSLLITGFNRSTLRSLLNFGGWLTISNVIGPVMVYFDRFAIAMVLSMAAVGYYAAPYEVITRLWLVPAAVAGVVFPAFSTALVSHANRAFDLFASGATCIFVSLFPIALIFVTGSSDILELWLGKEFAEHSSVVLQILAIGVFMNSLAYLPYALIQAEGRSDLTAKLHLLEVVPYSLLLWVLLNEYGLIGVACAWALRIMTDTVCLFLLAGWRFPQLRAFIQALGRWTAVALTSFLIGSVATHQAMGLEFVVVTLVLFGYASWRYVFGTNVR
jgi:O-antigen/teichoic acid export membrane protein